MSDGIHIVDVDLGERCYPIIIGPGVMKEPSNLLPYCSEDQVMIVTNETVAPLYLDQLKQTLQGVEVHVTLLPDGEEHKSLQTAETIFDHLLEVPCDRTTTLIALGGGVVGDIAGFVAGCYQRGIDFIQIPTTLLSQVDSSVGGKTGVNHSMGKNMIGLFHQPKCVIADTEVLSTLPARELSAGLAEVIKYGLISDSAFFSWLETHIEGVLNLESDLVAYAIERSCRTKGEVVAADEREGGQRALLNLGHTFGHAIEAAEGYGVHLHGEAVAMGTMLAADLSFRLGWLESEEVARIANLYQRAGLPVIPPQELTAEDYLRLMAVDKKVKKGIIRLILLKKIGEAEIVSDYTTAQLKATLDSFSKA